MLEKLHFQNFFSIEEIYQKVLWEHNPLVWHPLLDLQKFFNEKKDYHIEVDIPSSTHLENKEMIAIGKGSVIEKGCYIKGPCIIGKNCTIRHGAYIRGFVITGDNCVIGHCSEIKSSIFLHNTRAAHFAYVGNSILGNNVNLGAGVKCANYRFDEGPITININEKKIDTGLKKMGAIVGDNAQIGCNCTLNPGTIIGKNTCCYPSLNIFGKIPSMSIVKSSSKLSVKKSRMLKKL